MVKFRVNGQEQSFDNDPSMPLLWYLRDELGLTGTKYDKAELAPSALSSVHCYMPRREAFRRAKEIFAKYPIAQTSAEPGF